MSDELVPLSASFRVSTGSLQVLFNHGLEYNLSLNKDNWSLRADGSQWTPLIASAIGATVGVNFARGKPGTGPSVCGYSPPPFDVKTPSGLVSLGFLDFSVAVTP